MTTDSVDARLRDIEARCAAGVPTFSDANGDEHPYLTPAIEAHDNLAWLVALVRRYRGALEAIGPGECPVLEAGDADCRHCGSYALADGTEHHAEDCPWRIAREAQL